MESPLKGIKTRYIFIDFTIAKGDSAKVATFISLFDMRTQQMSDLAQIYLIRRN